MTPAWHWSARPARRGWGRQSPRESRPASAALLLELGGNNGAIVAPTADLDLTVRGIVFASVGTAGQRCTSLRRVIAHEAIADELCDRIISAYRSLPIGSPRRRARLSARSSIKTPTGAIADALAKATADGGTAWRAQRVLADEAPAAYYVQPVIIRMPVQSEIVCSETFAPILYMLTYSDFDRAIALHNGVPQGLSSSIFTMDVREAEKFVSGAGSDCGIANVNVGPSGAEIGGAFGGRRRPAEAGNPVPTRGRPTCGAPRTR